MTRRAALGRRGGVWARRATLALVATTLGLSAAAETNEEKRQRIEAEASAAQERALAATASADQHGADQRRLSAALASLGPRIVARETALLAARERLDGLRADVADAERRLETARETLGRLTAAAQRAAREPTPSLLIHPDRPVAAARSALLLRRLSEELKAARNAARAELSRIAAAERDAAAIEATARAELAALRADEAEVRSLLARKQDALARASAAAAEAEADAARLSAEAEDLGALIAALAATPTPRERPSATLDAATDAAEDTPRQDVAAADATSAPSEPEAASTPQDELAAAESAPQGLNWPAPAPLPAAKPPFADSKGAILRPVAGRLLSANEADALAETHGRRGVTFLTPPYARVISPWDGVVRYAGPFPNYGHVVIIEPQTGYQLLLTGLAAVDRAVEERVYAGEPLGRMGGPPPTTSEFLYELSSETRSARERLYFEIRRRGDPIDPEPWLQPAANSETGKVSGL